MTRQMFAAESSVPRRSSAVDIICASQHRTCSTGPPYWQCGRLPVCRSVARCARQHPCMWLRTSESASVAEGESQPHPALQISEQAKYLPLLAFHEAYLYRRWLRQASVSPKADTVEELQSRRKRLHVGMAKLAYDDLHRQVVQVQADAQVRNGLPCPR